MFGEKISIFRVRCGNKNQKSLTNIGFLWYNELDAKWDNYICLQFDMN